MSFPLPDFGDEDDDFTLPEPSITRQEFFSLSNRCDPETTFSATSATGIQFDIDNPIYQTKTSVIYIGMANNVFYALKTTHSASILQVEHENFQKIGEFPTIIKAFDFWMEQNQSLFLQLEYANGGSIANSLLYFTDEDVWQLLAHISAALHHIHQLGYIHLDISPSNILQFIESNKTIIYKLTDFGTLIADGTYKQFCEGAGPYVSPEAIKWPHSNHPVSFPTDIWSFGAVLFEIVTEIRFPRDPAGFDAIHNGTYDLSIIPEKFNFIRSMLNINPSLRPTAYDLMEIPKVKEILNMLTDKSVQVHFDNSLNQEVNLSHNDVDIRRRQSFDGM